ncbi:recombinase family protein [Microvirga sp.]|uniref:recombinase family protein n=1 Tax=Microvirga sp. TaxID=1873136 RepID=UPI0028A5AAD7|nr:recombinase family protein [Microvirga sp.]
MAAFYVENESGAKLTRPELCRLLSDAHPGDILLIEQVDRFSRLTVSDRQKLKVELTARKVRVVALNLPPSWMMASPKSGDSTIRMFDAVDGMMLEMSAAVARRDYQDRRRRQAQARAEGRRSLQGAHGGYGPQCRHLSDAESWFVMVADTGHYQV